MCPIIFLPGAWSILNIIQEAFLCSVLPNLFLEGNNKRKEECFFLIPLVLLIVIVDSGPNCASIYNMLITRDLSLFS